MPDRLQVAEEQGKRIDFRGDVHAVTLGVLDEPDHAGTHHVQHMQRYRCRSLEFEQNGDRHVPDDAAQGRFGVRVVGEAVVLAGPGAFLEHVQQRLVVGMHHQDPAGVRDCLGDPQQVPVLMNAESGHVRVGTLRVDDHVHLEAERAHRGKLGDVLDPRRCGVVIEIDDGTLLLAADEVGVALRSRRGRVDVGHSDAGRDPAESRGRGRRRDVFLMRESRIAMMRVGVDGAREHVKAGCVDVPIGLNGPVGLLLNGDDLAIADADLAAGDRRVGRMYGAAADDKVERWLHEASFS